MTERRVDVPMARSARADAYSALVLEHFDRPRNVGRFAPSANVIESRSGGRDRGTAFVLSAQLQDGRVRSLRAQVFGCPHCIAAASLASEQLQGADEQRLRDWSWREVAGPLEIPAQKRGHLLLLEDAVRALARELAASAHV